MMEEAGNYQRRMFPRESVHHPEDAFAMLNLDYTFDHLESRARQAKLSLARKLHPDSLSFRSSTNPNLDSDRREICDTKTFAEVTFAEAKLRDWEYLSKMEGIVVESKSELQRLESLSTLSINAPDTSQSLRSRVFELLCAHDCEKVKQLSLDIEPRDQPGTMQVAKPSRTRRRAGRKARKLGPKGNYSKPRDPTKPTCHLFIANTGPRFGITVADIKNEISRMCCVVATIEAPGLNANHVYATLPTEVDALKVRETFDRTKKVQMLGRTVNIVFAERYLPMTLPSNVTDVPDEQMTPSQLLGKLNLAMQGTEEEEAGNIPSKSDRNMASTPLLRCPLCSSSDAVFQSGRPFRMHLLSTVHALSGPEVAYVVRTAEANSVEYMNDEIAGKHETNAVQSKYSNGELKCREEPEMSSHFFATDEAILCARNGDLEGLVALVDAGWSPLASDHHGSTSLHWAAGAGFLNICKYLVDDQDVPVDQCCSTGRADQRNALHWAARNGQIEVCEWLVHEKKLGINIGTVDGTTPFHWAVWQQQINCCRWLRDNGANIYAINKYGCNASHWAALSGNLPLCEWLFALDIDFELVNNQGHSPMHKAAYNGRFEVCEWLQLNTKLNALQKDGAGYTSTMIARERGHLWLLSIFECASEDELTSTRDLDTPKFKNSKPSGPIGALMSADQIKSKLHL